jgi:magnesium transporter
MLFGRRGDAQPLPASARPRAPRIRPGTPPGTLSPAPADERTPPTVTVVRFTTEDLVETATRDIAEAMAACRKPGVTWVNVDGLDAEVLTRLGEVFGLHALALEDALNVPQRPKVDRYQTYYFVVLRMIRAAPSVEEEQVSIFFGQEWVLTVQERPTGDVFDIVRDAIRQDRGQVRRAGADYLAYLLLDAVVDGYYPVLEQVSEAIDAAQDETLRRPRPPTLWTIQRLRRDTSVLRRAIWPIREEVAALQRDESGLVAAETKVFLRDAHDHAVQALDIVESFRETLTSLTEIYLSTQNQRLNEVMKVLTVIATVFIPLTFIASIYGMNFEFMPELRWRYGYLWALGLMAASAGGLVLYFRRRGWW